jgi:hypothetical protein
VRIGRPRGGHLAAYLAPTGVARFFGCCPGKKVSMVRQIPYLRARWGVRCPTAHKPEFGSWLFISVTSHRSEGARITKAPASRLGASRDGRKFDQSTVAWQLWLTVMNIKYGKAVFPWAASGRAIANGRDEGFTKLLFDESNHRLLGGGIVGTHAGDLIGEVCLAVEMGCDPIDIGKTIHPHPTLSESIGMAAEVFEGVCTDLPPSKKN